MVQVIESSFLQALGYSIINSLWQFALLWLVYFLINIVCKLSAHHKYTIALLLQLTGFIWFTGTLAFYYQKCASYAGTISNYDYSYNPISASAASGKDKLFAWISRTEQFLPYLSIAYLLLLLFLSIRWLQSYKYTRKIKNDGLSKINVEWKLFVQTLSQQLGINRRVKIFLSSKINTPLTIGFFKPIILIPLASINHLTTEQMEAVILHELAHIKRLDYLVNLLLSVVEAIMFFNPFMQLLSKHIKRERENCCDDWVLQYEYNAATYAKALLQIAMFQTPQLTFAMNAAENTDVLLTRVKRIIEKSERSFHYRHQLIALLVITIILSSVSFLADERQRTFANSSIQNIEILAEPLAAKIENPLFNPVFFLANEHQENLEMEAETRLEKRERPVQKISRLNRLPLAVPQKQRNLNVSEIPAPVISNPLPIAKSKLQVAPRVLFNIDTTLLKRLLSTKWLVEIEKTEKDVQKNLAKVIEKSSLGKPLPNSDKTISEMKSALSQIRVAKVKMLRTSPGASTTRVYTKSGNNLSYQEALASELQRFEQENEDMHALAEEINKVLKEVQINFYTQKTADYLNYHVPAVIYTQPEPHTYSYEFTEKPRVRVLNRTTTVTPPTSCEDEVIVTRGASATAAGERIKPGTVKPAQLPATPALKASSTGKKVRPIVHI